jgi:hypothetical protein
MVLRWRFKRWAALTVIDQLKQVGLATGVIDAPDEHQLTAQGEKYVSSAPAA